MNTNDTVMANKFECDSCKELFEPDMKRGYIELNAINSDILPHANFRAKLDLCNGCFNKYQQMFININPLLKPFTG